MYLCKWDRLINALSPVVKEILHGVSLYNNPKYIWLVIMGNDRLCSGKGEIIDWFCCISNLQPSDYTRT